MRASGGGGVGWVSVCGVGEEAGVRRVGGRRAGGGQYLKVGFNLAYCCYYYYYSPVRALSEEDYPGSQRPSNIRFPHFPRTTRVPKLVQRYHIIGFSSMLRSRSYP